VDNDLPRDEAITLEIMAATTGYAIAGYTGQIVREFRTFAEADKARRNARVSFNVDVDIDNDAVTDDTEAEPVAPRVSHHAKPAGLTGTPRRARAGRPLGSRNRPKSIVAAPE